MGGGEGVARRLVSGSGAFLPYDCHSMVIHSLLVMVCAIAVVWTGATVVVRARARAHMLGRASVLFVDPVTCPQSAGPQKLEVGRLRRGVRGRRREVPLAVRDGVAAVGAMGAVVVLLDGGKGIALGLVAAAGVWHLRSRGRRAAALRAERQSVADALPDAADLLASCLAVGADPGQAAEAVGQSLTGPVGAVLRRVAAERALGAEPEDAWAEFAALPGARPLARCLVRATLSGASAADAVGRLAKELRAESARATVARARRAGVLVTAPLAICFLPAFLAVGVMPVLFGLAGRLLEHT